MIQISAAVLPFTSDLRGDAAIPAERRAVVFGGALVAWGLAEGVSRFAWRLHAHEGGR